MLRNTGSYGPNDRVVNMENGQSMPQVNGAMEMLHNLSNPTKTPQQVQQTANSRYNLPEYTSFAHNPYNMRPGFMPFPNYNFGGFPSNYNPHIFQDNSINNVNGMLPMNPNPSLGHSANFMDYSSAFSKRPNDYQTPSSYMHQGMYDKNYPINIPHVPSKMFDKPYTDRAQHNFMTNQEYKSHYSDLNALKEQNLAYTQQSSANSLMLSTENKECVQRGQMIPMQDHHLLPRDHSLTSNQNLDLSSRLINPNMDLSSRPVSQNLDLSHRPVSQNLDLSHRTVSQNLDVSNRSVSQNLDLSNRPVIQNLDLSSRPVSQNLDLTNRPIHQNLDLSSRPVSQNLDLTNRPIHQNLDLSSRPVSQNLDLTNRPIHQNLDLSSRAVSQNLDLTNRPILQNLDLSSRPVSQNLDLTNRLIHQNLDLSSRPVSQNLDVTNRTIHQNLDLSSRAVHTITSNTPSKGSFERVSSLPESHNTAHGEIKHSEIFPRTYDKPAIEALDSTRRKNIENTVRFIEDILMKSCPQTNRLDPNVEANLIQEELKEDSEQISDNNSGKNNIELDNNDVNMSENTESLVSEEDDKNGIKSEETLLSNLQEKANTKLEEDLIQLSDITDVCTDPINHNDYKPNDDPSVDTNHAVFFKTAMKTDNNTDELKQEKSNESIDADVIEETEVEETDPSAIVKVKQEPMEVEVKLEYISSWTDVDFSHPFYRDTNGTHREDVMESSIMESEKSIEEATSIVKHNLSRKTDTHFECPNCSLVFKNPKRFLIHVKWHTFGLTNEKRLEVQRAKEMRKQLRKETKREERLKSEMEDGDDFTCKDCGQVFNSKSTLKNHRSRKHPTKVRTCTICSKEVLGFRQLKAHMMTHQNDTSYQCDQCPKKFKFPQSLAKHSGVHMEKTHPCNQCDKKFGSDNLLKTHMLCHKRAQRGPIFGCSYCGKGFYEMYSLQAHERTHRNEKPFSCELCNSSYSTNSSLKRHLKVAHEGIDGIQKPYYCELCNTSYTANSSLKRHLKVSHENESKPFTCTTCQRCFINAIILERHVKRAHGTDDDFKYKCAECSTKYIHQRDFKKHMWKVHGVRSKRKRNSESEFEPND